MVSSADRDARIECLASKLLSHRRAQEYFIWNGAMSVKTIAPTPRSVKRVDGLRIVRHASYVSGRMRLHGLLYQLPLALLVCVCCLAFPQPSVGESSLPLLAPGTSIDAGQWRVKPVDARLSTEHPLRQSKAQGESYLLVQVELTNLMQRSSRDYGFVVHLDHPELKQLGEPSSVLVRDMALPDRLHPEMPEALLLVWQWPAGVAVPKELRLSIHAKTFKPVDNLVGSPGWFNPAPVASATLSLSTQ